MGKLSDTSPEAERVRSEAYRKISLEQKWLMLGEDYKTARLLHAAGYRLRNPSATRSDIVKDWMAVNLGFVAPDGVEVSDMNQPVENLRVIREVGAAFEKLSIPYVLGGSMASSIYGMDRATKDADISVEPFLGQEAQFVGCFGKEYYLSLPAILEAVRKRSSFNIIHTSTGFKVDVFIRKERPFDQSVLRRRQSVVLSDPPPMSVPVVSAEDVILLKLEWYRLGNESSETQWQDILGVLKIQAGRLDEAYLDHWATELNVGDQLARARAEAHG